MAFRLFDLSGKLLANLIPGTRGTENSSSTSLSISDSAATVTASQHLRLKLAQKLTAAAVGGSTPFSHLLELVSGLSNAAETLTLNDAAWKHLAAYAVGIVDSIADLIEQTASSSSETFLSNVAELNLTLEEISKLLSEMTSKGRMAAYLNADLNAGLIANCHMRLEGALDKFQLQAAISVQKVLAEDRMALSQDKDMDLIRTLPSTEVTWDPRETCLRNTRVAIIKIIVDWTSATGSVGSNILWLSGMAGRGKTAIAHSIAEQLYRKGLLSCFFFNRDNADQNNTRLVFSSLAKDLALHNPHIRSAIADALRADDKLGISAPAFQFSELVSNPVSSLLASPPEDRIHPQIVIWDALDECRDLDAFLRIITHQLPHFPPSLKFIITSRPAPEIKEVLTDMGALHYSLDAPTLLKDCESDLTAYIQTELSKIPLSKLGNWFSETDVAGLVHRAGGLFIWASTAVKYIKHSLNPKAQLHQLLREPVAEAEAAMDKLYETAILAPLAKINANEFSEGFQLVIGAIIVLQKPLQPAALTCLIQYPHTIRIITELCAVLDLIIPGGEVQILHQSFSDFLTASTRCKDTKYYIDQTKNHARLAKHCLQIMHKSLHYDMCNILSTGRLLNNEVQDLAKKLQHNIPAQLQYACFYWASHVQNMPEVSEILDLLHVFYSNDLLSWLEVMSLAGQLSLVITSMQALNRILKDQTEDASLIELSDDALRFVEHSAYIISTSACHLYSSALAFTPKETGVYQRFSAKRCIGMTVVQGVENHWGPCWKVIELSNYVTAIAFSPDGSHIVSGSQDGTIQMWDAQTGQPTLPSLMGHSKSVWSIDFSRDGHQIVSGSDDCTVRVWDAQKRKATFPPFEGHLGSVSSVAFSPDGLHIVSGSSDHTICVWDAQTVQPALLTLTGHTGMVMSVTFSPDGSHIVSGSSDHTICVWDAQTVQPALITLTGHEGMVLSVTFSPDGHQIASGSNDCTICLWDAQTGQPSIPPLQGHSQPVYSIAFSPDSHWIVTGSRDQTIRVWDVQTGQSSLLLKGHSDSVWSVAFSPDGRQIASGSSDCTVRLWDAQTGQPSVLPLEGHNQPVYSIAFSPDGTQIVTGSHDQTIRVWDAQTGKASLLLLEGQSDSIVRSTTFTPESRPIVFWPDDHPAQTDQTPISPLEQQEPPVYSIPFSINGLQMVTGSRGHPISVIGAQPKTGQSLPSPLDRYSVYSVAFSQDGCVIISETLDGVHVWDVQKGVPLLPSLEGNSQTMYSIAFSHDVCRVQSRSFGCCHKDKALFWERETGERDEIEDFVEAEQDHFYLSEDFWLFSVCKGRMCWIPPIHRGCIMDSTSDCVVLASDTGRITIIRFA